MKQRKKINEVFTPRKSNVNEEMYIDRGDAERNLAKSIERSLHVFLSGESGLGKSWLYKKLFKDLSVGSISINCSRVSGDCTFLDLIELKLFQGGGYEKVGYKQTKKAGVGVGVLKADLNCQSEYRALKKDRILVVFKRMAELMESSVKVIVLENVEMISNRPDALHELSGMLMLLDDEDYAEYGIKLLLVGTPHGSVSFFSSLGSKSSVANRVTEIQDLVGFDAKGVRDFCEKGFCDLLLVDLNEDHLSAISKHILRITLGIPQSVHEYCEALADVISDSGWVYQEGFLNRADEDWLDRGLHNAYATVKGYLNSASTSDGRRNQVLFALGQMEFLEFDTNQVARIIQHYFQNSAPDRNSGIGKILSHLTKGDDPLLKTRSNSDTYAFCDPRHLMVIRLMLFAHDGIVRVRSLVKK